MTIASDINSLLNTLLSSF